MYKEEELKFLFLSVIFLEDFSQLPFLFQKYVILVCCLNYAPTCIALIAFLAVLSLLAAGRQKLNSRAPSVATKFSPFARGLASPHTVHQLRLHSPRRHSMLFICISLDPTEAQYH